MTMTHLISRVIQIAFGSGKCVCVRAREFNCDMYRNEMYRTASPTQLCYR